nr:hypothetical protein [Streptococcus ruminantium]
MLSTFWLIIMEKDWLSAHASRFEKMQSFDKIALWVLEGNARAIAFYEKIGFRFDGVTKTVKLGVDRVEHRMVFRK